MSMSDEDTALIARAESRAADDEAPRQRTDRIVLEQDPVLELDELPRLRRLIDAAGERQRREVANG